MTSHPTEKGLPLGHPFKPHPTCRDECAAGPKWYGSREGLCGEPRAAHEASEPEDEKCPHGWPPNYPDCCSPPMPEPPEPPDELRERVWKFLCEQGETVAMTAMVAFVRSEIARAAEEAYREAANCIDGAAKELEECAASYEDRALGHPKENMLRQATHWRQAAESIRALQKRSER